VRVEAGGAAYWCRLGARPFLRRVLPHAEETMLDALARLRAAGEEGVVPGSRYAGSFRAHGLSVPVWELPEDCSAEDLSGPVEALSQRLARAMTVTAPLTDAERRARSGVVSRQLTLR
jgi:hypothetical protein